MPATRARRGLRSSITSSTSFLRSDRGLRRTRRFPEFPAGLASLVPTVEEIPATAGCARMRSVASFWCRTISAKETPGTPSVYPMNCPVSSLERKPFGMNQKRNAVTRKRMPETTRVAFCRDEHPLERPLVEVEPRLEDALGRPEEAALVRDVRRLQETAAEHGREAERHEPRDEDRDADRDRELLEQPAEEPAHEEHGDEHGDEGERHRQDREADLAAALERRREDVFPALHPADDVLEHDDRVVHDEPDGQRERH